MVAELDSIVRVTAQIVPAAATARAFGRTLFLYQGDATPTARAEILSTLARDARVNIYSDLTAAGRDYATTHPAYATAQSYFAQVPYPRHELLPVGWFPTGAPGYVVGATGQTGTTVLTAIKAVGATTITVAGQSVAVDLNVTGTGTTGYQAAASAIQTALRTVTSPDLSAVTCAYNETDGAFLVTAPIGIDLGGALSGPGAEAVGLAGTGSTYVAGTPIETIQQAMDRIDGLNDSWYWLIPDSTIYMNATNMLALATWVANKERQIIVDQHSLDVLTANETTSLAAQLFARETKEVSTLWSAVADRKSASASGRFASVDLDEDDSLITLFGKTLPGRAADSLTAAQRAELDRKRINYYTSVAGSNIVRPGVTSHPDWYMDTLFLVDWLKWRIRNDVYRLIHTSRRVPLDDRGRARVLATVEAACEAGVRNGGLAPGPVSETFANDIRQITGAAFDANLGRGYLVYVAPISSMTNSEGASREAPTTYVWLRGSSAVHFIEIPLLFTE